MRILELIFPITLSITMSPGPALAFQGSGESASQPGWCAIRYDGRVVPVGKTFISRDRCTAVRQIKTADGQTLETEVELAARGHEVLAGECHKVGGEYSIGEPSTGKCIDGLVDRVPDTPDQIAGLYVTGTCLVRSNASPTCDSATKRLGDFLEPTRQP
ncbi:MAG: hypothetical protein AB7G93_18610 [Bdellovibrionales bacterium]